MIFQIFRKVLEFLQKIKNVLSSVSNKTLHGVLLSFANVLRYLMVLNRRAHLSLKPTAILAFDRTTAHSNP